MPVTVQYPLPTSVRSNTLLSNTVLNALLRCIYHLIFLLSNCDFRALVFSWPVNDCSRSLFLDFLPRRRSSTAADDLVFVSFSLRLRFLSLVDFSAMQKH